MIDEPGGPLDDSEEEGDVEDRESREPTRLFDRAVPDAIRRVVERAVESGVERLAEGPENLRHRLGELKLSKDALHFLYGQMDDTKKGLYRVVAKEIRDVLQHTSFADEIARLLTKLSFEITTQVRFVPNSEAQKASGSDADAASEDRPPAEGSEPADAGKGERSSLGLPRPQVVSRVAMKTRERPGRPAKE
jgi:hypothetical protein